MPEIDGWADHISEPARNVWPILGRAVKKIDGFLVGGTALAIHLRHRTSFDLDYLAAEPFTGDHLARSLMREIGDVEVIDSGSGILHARVLGIAVQVFCPPPRGANPGVEDTLQKPLEIDGMRVASLPDLLATKLDVIMYRPKLRDYIDLKAIDEAGPYSLEDGLLFHMRRYGTTSASKDLERIINLLDSPGELDPDRMFGHQSSDTLAYLKARTPALRRHLYQMRVQSHSASRPKPFDPPMKFGPTE